VLAIAALAIAAVALISAHRAQRDVDSLDGRVGTLERAVGDTSGFGFEDLESRVSDLEGADLDGRVGDLNNRVSDLEQNIADICSGVADANTNSATEELIDDILLGCP